MNRNIKQLDELRRRAEAHTPDSASTIPFPESLEGIKRLVHELSVHEIELEMQNEELRSARAELEESLAQTTDLYDFAPTPYFTLDPEGKIQRANLAGAKLLGLERFRLMGRRFEGFLEGRCQAEFNAMFRDLFAFQTPHVLTLEGAVGKQGQKAIYITLTQSRDRRECRVSAIDVTERKRAVTALAQSNALLNTLLQTIPFPMDIVDATGRVLFSNGMLELAVGTQTLDRRCWEMYKDDGQQCLRCPLHERIQIGRKTVLEVEAVLGGRTFEIHHTGMLYAGLPALLEVFLDVTDRKKAERERKGSGPAI